MEKNTIQNLLWLIGGTIGVAIGLALSLYFINNVEMPNPILYSVAHHICALIIVVFVFLGGAFGIIIGKIIPLLGEIYVKK